MQRSSRAVRVSGFLLACAVCAGPAIAGSVFMKFDGVDVPGPPGTGEIEIHSFHWGATRQPQGQDLGSWSKADGLGVNMGSSPASSDITMKGSKIGENAPRGTGANQMTMDDTAGKEKARRGTSTVDANETITIHGGRTEGDPDRPIIAGTVPARGSPKLTQYAINGNSPAVPEPKGSVWIRVATPWTTCRAGTRFPGLELGDGKASYRLSEVVVTRCGADGVGLDYAKVTVRGWDPAKKEE